MKERSELPTVWNLSDSERFSVIDMIYRAYPRKEGKLAGMKKLHQLIKTQQDADRLMKATDNYSKLLKAKGTPKDFVLMFSTFVNGRWQDYEDCPPLDTAHMELLAEVGLQFQFSRHIDNIKTIWPNVVDFRNYLVEKKTYCSKSYNIQDQIERFRAFVANDLSRKLGC